MSKIGAKLLAMTLVIAMLGTIICTDIAGIGWSSSVYAEDATEQVTELDTETTTETATEPAAEQVTAEELAQASEELAEAAQNLGAINPKTISDATSAIAKAISDLTGDTSKLSALTVALNRISSIASIASGGIAILQLCGVIKDPTTQQLENIMSLLQEHTTILMDLRNELNKISNQLYNMQANQELKDRAQTAISLTNEWNEFTTNYIEKLEEYCEEYESYILQDTCAWACSKNHGSLCAYYTMIKQDGKTVPAQTFRREYNPKANKSDNDELIATSLTVGLPKEYVDAALKDYTEEKWRSETYREDISKLLAEQIFKAIKDGKLDCSTTFKNTWNAADAKGKAAIAKQEAEDLLDAAIYNVSFKTANTHTGLLSNIVTTATQMLKKTMTANTGISAQIIPLQKTNNFEGDIKDKITKVYDQMLAIDGIYSMFAMSLAGQSQFVSKERRDKLCQTWIDCTKYLERGKEPGVTGSALTGHDNYCYVTGSLVTWKEYEVRSQASITTNERTNFMGVDYLAWKSRNEWKWEVTGASENSGIVENVYAIVLKSTWQANKKATDKSTFTQYLNKNGTSAPKETKDLKRNYILTTYNGPKIFDLTTTYPMIARDSWTHSAYEPGYFKTNQETPVMSDKSKWNKTCLHEVVKADVISTDDGSLTTNKDITGRAEYIEAKRVWKKDEPWFFSWKDSDYSKSKYTNTESSDETHTHYHIVKQPVYVLECTQYTPKKEESVTTAETDYVPLSDIEEMKNVGIIDDTYNSHDTETIIDTEAWKNLDVEYFSKTQSAEEIKSYYSEYIDALIQYYENEGVELDVSSKDKAKLENRIAAIFEFSENELAQNGSIASGSLDPFGIYGNDTAMEELAMAVLPDNEIATDGQTMEPVKNMMTAVYYEPYVYLTVEKSNGKNVIKPHLAYAATPYLLVWCEQENNYNMFIISDAVMAGLGLTMKLRFSAASAGNNSLATVVHYADDDATSVLETKTALVQGSGSNRYAEVSVSSCSLFEVSFSQPVNTGDNADIVFYIILLSLLCLTIVAFAKKAWKKA